MSEMNTIYYVPQIILGDIVLCRGFGGNYRLSTLMQSLFFEPLAEAL